MKKLFKKTSSMLFFIVGISFALVGCGTDADSGGMGSKSSISKALSK